MTTGATMAEHDEAGWYDDTPSADPAIRLAYEAALGRLILAHNELDYRLTTIIELAVAELSADPDLLDLAKGDFAARVRSLRLLKALPAKLPLERVECDKLLSLNSQRNIVAHGHFDQNPFDGSFTVLEQRRWNSERKRKAQEFPIPRLERLASDMAAEADNLRHAAAIYDFLDVTLTGVHEGSPDGE